MPANMMSAPVGSSFTVSGSSIATVSAGPTPGSTPTNVPSVTPMKPHIRFIGCSATPKPAIRAFRASMSDARAAEDRREPAGRQVDVQQLDEKKIDRERKDETDRHVAHPSSATEAARHAGEQGGAGNHEAGPANQQHVDEEPGADPEKRAGLESFRLLAGLAPAAGKGLEGEPSPEQENAGGDHRRDEVRADAGVAAFRGQGRGHHRDPDAESHDAERKRDLGAGALHLAYFFRPSDSMMPAMRCSSCLRNLA